MSRRVVIVGLGLCLVTAVALAVRNHHGGPAQKEAQAACTAYAEVSGRHQLATTRAQTYDFVRSTVNHALNAGSLDARWIPLRADIESYLRLWRLLPQATEAQSRLYFTADWHVEGDCSLAGRTIGDLKP